MNDAMSVETATDDVYSLVRSDLHLQGSHIQARASRFSADVFVNFMLYKAEARVMVQMLSSNSPKGDP